MDLVKHNGALLERVDFFRFDACRQLGKERRSEMGQFFTPPSVARFMASMFENTSRALRVLDAGAGVGSLLAALVEDVCSRESKPKAIDATAYEMEPALAKYLQSTFSECGELCERFSVAFSGDIQQMDFIQSGVDMLRGGLFSSARRSFNCAILNPPYHKINTDSQPRRLLRALGVETTNLYTGFLAIAVQLLEQGGELVAITPRSFCNGPYFKSFRKLFLDAMTVRRVHVFESRSRAFSEDDVLQENVIIHAVKGAPRGKVIISSSESADDEFVSRRDVDYAQLVDPGDPDMFIHVVADELGRHVAEQMRELSATLSELNVAVSTGRVVDFRSTTHLRAETGPNTAPLIYPGHFSGGFVTWPKNGKKPNALAVAPATRELLVPSGYYVLVKRFSSKEERRRVVAAVFDPRRIPAPSVGFENHLNVYHREGKGLPPNLAKGLAAFLNSTLVDSYFRQFSGHTQVNATDLRSLRYPTGAALEALGADIDDVFPSQEAIDSALRKEMSDVSTSRQDPIQAKKRLEQSLSILKALDFPREQLNERSALTLLALLDVKPDTSWSEARDPLCGITPMMEFFSEHYGKTYAPNSRETVRRFTVHQFLDAGLVVANPDKPTRPVNSPKAVYQIEAGALKLLQTFDTKAWDKNLSTYRASVESLRKRYAREREMDRLPVAVASGKTITLSPGGQNELIKCILEEFCQRFTPGGKLLYIGDTDEKWGYFDEEALAAVGVVVDSHGKMPDVVVHHVDRNWLVLIEAVTSHGPVNPKRRSELQALFKGSSAGLVFVTTFLSRKAMMKYVGEISWETEVWVADAPSHMIHFNGERFLGPHED